MRASEHPDLFNDAEEKMVEAANAISENLFENPYQCWMQLKTHRANKGVSRVMESHDRCLNKYRCRPRIGLKNP